MDNIPDINKVETITPLTINQINNQFNINNDKIFEIDKTKIEYFLLVGKIKKIDKKYNRIKWTVDDSTGEIHLIIIKNITENNPKILKNNELKINDYYKFYCNLNRYKETIFLVNTLDKISNLNEYTFHLVSCLKSYYIRKFGYKDSIKKEEEKVPIKKEENKLKQIDKNLNNQSSKKNEMKIYSLQNPIKADSAPIKINKKKSLYEIVYEKILEVCNIKKIRQFTPSLLYNDLRSSVSMTNLINILSDLNKEGKIKKESNIYYLGPNN